MVDRKHFRSDEPDIDNYDDLAQPRTSQYAFGRSANTDYDSVPLFLSDPESAFALTAGTIERSNTRLFC